MNLGESIQEVRAHLNNPLPASPSNRHVLQKLQDVAQLLHLEMLNTSQAWDVETTRLTTNPNQSDYLLAISDSMFSKDLRIVTVDDADPDHISRDVPRCDLQDIKKYYQGPERATQTKHTAKAIAMYRKGTVIYCKIVPTPISTDTYEIWYEQANARIDNLADQPTPTLFQRYRNIMAAEVLLPLCRWKEDDRYNLDMQARLGVGLEMQSQRFRKAWESYIAADRQDGATDRIGYAENWY